MQLTYPLAVVALSAVTLGFAAGVLFADARRAWRDYFGRKAELPLLRSAARLATSKAAGTVAAAAVVLAWSVWTLAGGER